MADHIITKLNMLDSSDRSSDWSEEAFTPCDRRSDCDRTV